MVFKPINTNHNYEISDTGIIRRIDTKQIIKPQEDKDGYLSISLWQSGECKRHRVHRLVLETFIGSPTGDKNEVHHKDNNRQNNSIENLEWVTRQENDSHVQHPINKGCYTPIQVQQLDLQGNIINEFESMSEAARQTGCNISHISQVCNGKRRTTGGYQWRKVEGSTTIM